MMSDEEATKLVEKGKRKARLLKIINPFVYGFFIFWVVFSTVRHQYAGAFLIIVSLIVSNLIYPVERLDSKYARVSLVFVAILTPWAAAFLIGYERSNDIFELKAPTEVITTGGKDIPVKLVRGGERGILFMEFETKKLNFIRWEVVVRIQSL